MFELKLATIGIGFTRKCCTYNQMRILSPISWLKHANNSSDIHKTVLKIDLPFVERRGISLFRPKPIQCGIQNSLKNLSTNPPTE